MIKRSAISAIAVSASLLVGVAVYEGYSDTPYLDSVGVPTIGFGRTDNVKPGKTTVQREMISLLNDLDWRKREISKCITVPLYPWELQAYLSLAYNIGTSAFCKSTLVKRLNAGEYAEACREILRWNRAGGRELAGLTRRREAEYRTCTGADATTATVGKR